MSDGLCPACFTPSSQTGLGLALGHLLLLHSSRACPSLALAVPGVQVLVPIRRLLRVVFDLLIHPAAISECDPSSEEEDATDNSFPTLGIVTRVAGWVLLIGILGGAAAGPGRERGFSRIALRCAADAFLWFLLLLIISSFHFDCSLQLHLDSFSLAALTVYSITFH
ncbi:hypothetical protein B0H10DRAFT_2088557 [Mycena sp. CBHHK59/15]|nr:hypothetical protein B0H10DRAFT_2088557 [Mycena sp. CBHHK59/15]